MINVIMKEHPEENPVETLINFPHCGKDDCIMLLDVLSSHVAGVIFSSAADSAIVNFNQPITVGNAGVGRSSS